jgi:NADP-dependent 3-hydroxy acid dehydrogenase YdfG
MSRSGKHVLITGIANGLGRSLGLCFLRKGWNVSGIDRLPINDADMESLQQKIQFQLCDIGKAPVELSPFLEEYGNFDALINNAGVAAPHSFFSIPEEVIEDTILTNVLGLMKVTRRAINHMNDYSCIVNIGSHLAQHSYHMMPVYTGSKHAVLGFTEGLRKHLKEMSKNIRITLLNPGMMDTNIVPEDAHKGDFWAKMPTDDVADEIFHIVNSKPHINIAEVNIRGLFSPID